MHYDQAKPISDEAWQIDVSPPSPLPLPLLFPYPVVVRVVERAVLMRRMYRSTIEFDMD